MVEEGGHGGLEKEFRLARVEHRRRGLRVLAAKFKQTVRAARMKREKVDWNAANRIRQSAGATKDARTPRIGGAFKLRPPPLAVHRRIGAQIRRTSISTGAPAFKEPESSLSSARRSPTPLGRPCPWPWLL